MGRRETMSRVPAGIRARTGTGRRLRGLPRVGRALCADGVPAARWLRPARPEPRVHHRDGAVRRRHALAKQPEREKRTSAENVLRPPRSRSGTWSHESHGIGRYLGLISMDWRRSGRIPHARIRRRRQAYVPVSQLQVISRYAGASAGMFRLPDSWAAATGRRPAARPPSRCATRPRSRCISMRRYARRARGYAFKLQHHDYEAFSAGFPFERRPISRRPSRP